MARISKSSLQHSILEIGKNSSLRVPLMSSLFFPISKTSAPTAGSRVLPLPTPLHFFTFLLLFTVYLFLIGCRLGWLYWKWYIFFFWLCNSHSTSRLWGCWWSWMFQRGCGWCHLWLSTILLYLSRDGNQHIICSSKTKYKLTFLFHYL